MPVSVGQIERAQRDASMTIYLLFVLWVVNTLAASSLLNNISRLKTLFRSSLSDKKGIYSSHSLFDHVGLWLCFRRLSCFRVPSCNYSPARGFLNLISG